MNLTAPNWLSKKLLTISMAGILSLGLSGCLFDRVVTVKNGMCEFESNFVVQLDPTMSFTFNHPVLLDSDALWISDSRPTRITQSGQSFIMSFEIEKITDYPEPESDFLIELIFIEQNGKPKLQEVRSDFNIGAILDQDMVKTMLVDSMAEQICSAGISFASTRLEYDIAEDRIALPPGRREIIEFLGTPSTGNPEDQEIAYRYRVRNTDRHPKIATVTIWFGEDGDQPVRVEAEYSRYRSVADFEERKLRMRLKI